MPKHVINNELVDQHWSKWYEIENKKTQYDCTARNIITSTLNLMSFTLSLLMYLC